VNDNIRPIEEGFGQDAMAAQRNKVLRNTY
jgi:hypothetical protein